MREDELPENFGSLPKDEPEDSTPAVAEISDDDVPF
jgi:hypothetical protein